MTDCECGCGGMFHQATNSEPTPEPPLNEQLYSYWDTLTAEIEQYALYMGLSAGLLGSLMVIDSVRPVGDYNNPTFTKYVRTVETLEPRTFTAVLKGEITIESVPNTKPLKYAFNKNELTALQNIYNKFKGLNIASHPKNVENLHWRNTTTIIDKIGAYGGIEAPKIGTLDTYIKAQEQQGIIVMVEWVSRGDKKTCLACKNLEANSPYPADKYPEPPHFACRCKPGDIIIIHKVNQMTGDELTLIYVYY